MCSSDLHQPLTTEQTTLALRYIMGMMATEQMRQSKEARTEVSQQQKEYFERLERDNPAVKKHPSGFYYEVLRSGKGRKARYADRIRFDYRSFLMLTGEPFDQTYGQRDPIIHVVGEPMFQGLIDAFQLMEAGSLYRFYFPYQLAFGENGTGDIPGFTAKSCIVICRAVRYSFSHLLSFIAFTSISKLYNTHFSLSILIDKSFLVFYN